MNTRRDFLKAVVAGPFVGGAALASAETSASDELRRQCVQGLKTRKAACTNTSHDGELTKAAIDRLNRELGVIHALHMDDFFLVLAEIQRLASRNRFLPTVVGPAAGSLITYALGLSPVCPLRHGLLFDRFLHRNTTTAPSITLLVCHERAEDLIQSVRSRQVQINPEKSCPQYRAWSTRWRRDGNSRPDHATIDVLPDLGLSIVRKTLEFIHKAGKGNLELDDIPDNDPRTLALFRRGRTEDIFQFQDRGIQEFLREAQPPCLADLTATYALYRPGPIREGIAAAFAHGRHGPSLRCRHRELQAAVAESRGVLIYDEQVMGIAHAVGGLELAEGFLLIKAIRKWDHQTADHLRARFCSGAQQRGIARADAGAIFDFAASACKHTFCKAHAAVCARRAYEMAFLRVQFASEFQRARQTLKRT